MTLVEFPQILPAIVVADQWRYWITKESFLILISGVGYCLCSILQARYIKEADIQAAPLRQV